MIPVRCFTCGKVIARYHPRYIQEIEKGRDPKDVLDELKIMRYCCRRMLLSNVEDDF
jgi:DNA-directed RNA polymerase subunit N